MLSIKVKLTLLQRIATSVLCMGAIACGNPALADDSSTTLNAEEQRANDVRHSYEIKVIDRLLEQFHYKEFHLDDALSETILDNFIDSLDPSRLFFTASDVQEIDRLKNSFDDYIRRGVTASYHAIFDIYRQRVKQRTDYALQRLEHAFNFTIDEYYVLDRSESLWAANEEELDALWRKRIKNEYLGKFRPFFMLSNKSSKLIGE